MVKNRGKIYLAYGSNLNLKEMSSRCPSASILGSSELLGYRLLFCGESGSAEATIVKQKDGRVPVLLWNIMPSDEEALDLYEEYPEVYRKEFVNVHFKGEWVSAMVYIMNEKMPLGEPDRTYYEVIRQGYLDAGFDLSILDKAVQDSMHSECEMKEKN
ncbi:gamma-glutamylcyclotransferase family protein [Calidifontibacillus erzurumensis]|uniref:Gamma-glutamylcyclotransferase n=1 Tax=Calidifontibacillus erzurumensis TaxID=2741433 RepID=A0A8J8GHN2_9BACI|nr:gamma-glutamylcyclotransferase family protein [Calidifontibacillus erzurumensis]NSL53351.1 gamma-glutamylcyclotransferase [Calidifontibacillus erzurumensis]